MPLRHLNMRLALAILAHGQSAFSSVETEFEQCPHRPA